MKDNEKVATVNDDYYFQIYKLFADRPQTTITSDFYVRFSKFWSQQSHIGYRWLTTTISNFLNAIRLRKGSVLDQLETLNEE